MATETLPETAWHLRQLTTACSVVHLDGCDTSRYPHTLHRGAFIDCPADICDRNRRALVVARACWDATASAEEGT
jgi:hypothetical protein